MWLPSQMVPGRFDATNNPVCEHSGENIIINSVETNPALPEILTLTAACL